MTSICDIYFCAFVSNIYIYLCMYVCMYVYTYTHIHTHTHVTLSVKSRLKSKNLIMRKQASKFDFYDSFYYNFKLWHDYT